MAAPGIRLEALGLREAQGERELETFFSLEKPEQ